MKTPYRWVLATAAVLAWTIGVLIAQPVQLPYEPEDLISIKWAGPKCTIPDTAFVMAMDSGVEIYARPQNATVADVCFWVEANCSVEYCEGQDLMAQIEVADPNDWIYQAPIGTWNLDDTSLPDADTNTLEALELASRHGDSIRIGIIDTGIDRFHPDLIDNFVAGRNFVGNPAGDPNFTDIRGHGTHVAGIAAAVVDNGLGVWGMAPAAEILSARVCGGSCGWWIYAFDWLAAQGADVVNLSLGGPAFTQAGYDAVNLACSRGMLIAAAAGNDGEYLDGLPWPDPNGWSQYPCQHVPTVDCMICVGNHFAAASLTLSSNFGEVSVDLSGPGSVIWSTIPDPNTVDIFSDCESNTNPNVLEPLEHGCYAITGGTSMASPHVAGVAALIWAEYPCASNMDVKQAIMESAAALSGQSLVMVTDGMVKADAALQRLSQIVGGSCPPGGGGGPGDDPPWRR